jgi:predicted enzyme related to lactoylglutathione lyase
VIIGAHLLLYSSNPEADRAFLRDVLGWRHVDVGHGWLIFAMPPSEAAVHPADDGNGAGASSAGHRMVSSHLYLLCDDIDAQMKWLASKNVTCSEAKTERWGIRTTVRLPSGAEIGLYQPRHELAIVR